MLISWHSCNETLVNWWGKCWLLHWSNFPPNRSIVIVSRMKFHGYEWMGLGTWFELVPSWELTNPSLKGTFEDDFPFPQVGYVSSLQDCPPWKKPSDQKFGFTIHDLIFRPEVGFTTQGGIPKFRVQISPPPCFFSFLFNHSLKRWLFLTLLDFPGDAVLNETYCWWTKSCTTKDDYYPIIHRVLTIPGGAGFHPSTVGQSGFVLELLVGKPWRVWAAWSAVPTRLLQLRLPESCATQLHQWSGCFGISWCGLNENPPHKKKQRNLTQKQLHQEFPY